MTEPGETTTLLDLKADLSYENAGYGKLVHSHLSLPCHEYVRGIMSYIPRITNNDLVNAKVGNSSIIGISSTPQNCSLLYTYGF